MTAMHALFVSDLHLDASRPDIADQFVEFLDAEAMHADELYILGDLFESWIGDDDPNEHYAWVKQSLRQLTKQGVPVFFMHGNRDFMIGDEFAAEAGVKILPDPHIAEFHGEKVLLSHGDAYCTDDHEYQAVRKMTRDPAWQAMMRQKSIDERRAFAAKARDDSLSRGEQMDDAIMDVNQQAIERALRDAGVKLMLHGHTHRPAVHEFELDGRPATRIVLGDWFDQGSVVRWDQKGPKLVELAR